MKKLSEFLTEEDKKKPDGTAGTDAAKQAKQLGLNYVGFGRYTDPKTGQVTYIVQNGRLVPFDKAVKTNSYVQQSGDDYGNLAKEQKPVLMQDMADLQKAYKPEKFTDDELDAIKLYTDANHDAVNTRLDSLPTGIMAKQIQPITPDDNTPEIIAAMDSALDKGKTPKDLVLFSTLGGDIDPSKFKPGLKLGFKGFRSTTVNMETAINDLDPTLGGGTVFQMNLAKGSKGLYADDFSSTPGQGEFILPRGAKIKITAGPTKMIGTYKSPDNVLDVMFYTCEVL